MMQGALPAETVEGILGPFLRDGFPSELSPHAQTEIENILRIYPEVAGRLGIELSPSISSFLASFWALLRSGKRTGVTAQEPAFQHMDALSPVSLREGQRPLAPARNPEPVLQARGFIVSTKGVKRLLNVCFEKDENHLCFEIQGLTRNASIYLCGMKAVSLGPAEPRGCFPLTKLADSIERNEIPELQLELCEEA
jgi:hypothetical protein